MIIVGTVVGDVQFAVAAYERQVTVAVEAAGAVGADGDEVTVIGIVDGGRGVAEDGGGVGIDLRGTRRGVTTGEDGIVDDDALLVDIRLSEGCPVSSAGGLVA